MIDVYHEIEANQFIQQFPHRTLAQNRGSYINCSADIQQKIRNIIDDKHPNVFVATLNMVIRLTNDASRCVVSTLLHHNEKAINKFLQMPIGKALEWYAVVERASRGKMIYLPVCHDILQKNYIWVMDRLKLYNLKKYKIEGRALVCYDLRKPYFRLNQQEEAETLFLDRVKIEKEQKDYWNYDSETKFLNVMDEIKAQLFQLTIQEMIVLKKVQYGSGFKGSGLSRFELEQLENLGRRINSGQLNDAEKETFFLAHLSHGFYYKYQNVYSLSNVSCFLKERVSDGMLYVFPWLAAPVVCALLSKFVETTFCQKTISEALMRELMETNENYALLNKVIQESGHEKLLCYCKTLINSADYMTYGWVDTIKMCLPFFLSFPALGLLCRLTEDYVQDREVLPVLFVWAGASWALSNLSIKWLLSLIPILACISILLNYHFGFHNFSFEIEQGEALFCDIPDLLKRTDIVIQ